MGIQIEQTRCSNEHSLNVLRCHPLAQNGGVCHAVGKSSECLLVVHSAHRAQKHNVECLLPVLLALVEELFYILRLAVEAFKAEGVV